MTAEPVLSVLILWHQHQPYYKDPLTNRYELPWARLHAIKDYYDMVAILDEFPKIRLNFNLVPSLLTQLDDYASGRAQDKFVELTLKRAGDLSFEDRNFLLLNFFMAHWENMIDPYPRYRELLEKRGRSAHLEDLSRIQNYFKQQDWLDLQVWFNLSWFDPTWRERDPFIRKLHEKGKGFSEEEKQELIQKQLAICGLVVAKYKEVQDRGQIEVTASPFYHPILPLLSDTNSALMAMPQVILPKERFRHPEDARTQIDKALADHERRFGKRPRGMWPSEGSVSEQTAELFAQSGVEWVATDESVLAQSVSPAPFTREEIYEPYQFQAGGKTLRFFFRDHELSDAIGFVYPGWNATDAVNDFIERLHGIRSRLIKKDGNQPRSHVVSVILDGENCWEYYQQDGLPFLRELYKRLSEDPTLETVLASDTLAKAGEIRTLSKLWAGSWINANFGIWIGHREDNTAWDLVTRTRDYLTRHLEKHPEQASSPSAQLAWEEIYIAEGSDWCWWYGDDHSSANDGTFDYLFRKHLMNVYSLTGDKPPEDLHLPIKVKRVGPAVRPPIDFITPQIDGRVTSYFEWQSAGLYETEAGTTGTMHRAQNLLKSIYYGFDLQTIYFRFDLSKPLDAQVLQGITLSIIFLNPEGYEVWVKFQGLATTVQLKALTNPPDNPLLDLPNGVAKKVIEVAVPLKHLPAMEGQSLQIQVEVELDGQKKERWPTETTISIPYPTQDTFAESWLI
ncbi:MAG: glycoside hydrolase family 57 protein [Elusimicrobiota bacterium]|jgi:alpha-amylase/alpha-mannosidase (GH57 family)